MQSARFCQRDKACVDAVYFNTAKQQMDKRESFYRAEG
ncbi:hypothetical protein WCP94_001859 [Bilophila wadsworthia]